MFASMKSLTMVREFIEAFTRTLNNCKNPSRNPLQMLLKGHGNEADFLGFLQKLVPHSRSLILPFEPFRFRPQIRGDIVIEKRLPNSPTRRVRESLTLHLGESESRLLNVKKKTRRVGESWTP
jgi:hypothetical protein